MLRDKAPGLWYAGSRRRGCERGGKKSEAAAPAGEADPGRPGGAAPCDPAGGVLLGKTQPDIETLTTLAEALNADVRELIYGPGREESYRRGQRKYAALAAICVAVLFIFCVLETVLRPFVQQICWETYDLMPWVWYALTVPSAAALAAGGLLMSGTALVVDLRLPSKRLRMMALIFGAVAIGYYLIFVIYCFGHRFIFLANIPGFVDWIKNMNYYTLMRYSPWFLTGCLVFLGLNK